MIRRLQILLGVGVLLSVSGAVLADGDAAAGKKVFGKCRACHVLQAEEGARHWGPSLHGIFGRPAATVEGFPYSLAMKASGIVWSEETIAEYMTNPKGYIPGNRMMFAGLKKKEDVDNLVAYLQEATE